MSVQDYSPDDDLSPDPASFDASAYQKSGPVPIAPDEVRKNNFELISGATLELHGPEYFNNYELSWLDFNFRVLDEARNPANPPIEQAKFIGIVCSNLDEFFQKRVGGLKRQLQAGVGELSVDGLTPLEQLKAIRKTVKVMIQHYRSCFFEEIVPRLREEGIEFRTYAELSKKERRKVDEYFDAQLYPILTPLIVDQAHPFPFISNKSRSFALEIMDDATGDTIFARIKVPDNRPRWFTVESKSSKTVLINIDHIIRERMGDLFPGATVKSAHIFRVTRNADLKRNEEEADDLLELIEEELRERRFADVVRLELEEDMPPHIKEILMDRMAVKPIDVFEMRGSIGLADCMQLGKISGFEHLRYKTWNPVLHPAFRSTGEDGNADIFSIIRTKDVLVHHPYHSFSSSVERFVQEAAADPKVLAIKQTLYRTSTDSSLMHALMKAVDAGKQVAVLVELKARFDEQQNMEWALKLEKAGIHVSYGIPGLKIHSKITVVVRDEGDMLRRYAHIGTGNYHPGTANLYEDLGLFTSDPELTSDVSDLFNFLTGYAPNQTYRKLLVAPNYLRNRIFDYIMDEIKAAQNGLPARIIMKMNSLEDAQLIQLLYYASSQGVQIDMIVRGVCRLKPGLKGLSENITVHSIIGRFLEHSRIYYFRHGEAHVYLIGSADIMHRNLDARVEAITPVENLQLKKYLRFLFQVQLNDNQQRWVMDETGTYNRVPKNADDTVVATHQVLMNHVLYNKDPLPVQSN